MAGTRLQIQVVFTVQFVLLLGGALYYGGILHHDNTEEPLSIALWQQGGRLLLRRLWHHPTYQRDVFQHSLPSAAAHTLRQALPAIHIVCQDSQVMFWKHIVATQAPSDDVLHVVGATTDNANNHNADKDDRDTIHMDLTKYCQRPEELLLIPQAVEAQHLFADNMILVCESWQPRDRPKMVTFRHSHNRRGITLFYPRSIAHRANDFAALYPQPSSLSCLSSSSLSSSSSLPTTQIIHLTLALPSSSVTATNNNSNNTNDETSWKAWMHAMQVEYNNTFQSLWRTLLLPTTTSTTQSTQPETSSLLQFSVKVVDDAPLQHSKIGYVMKEQLAASSPSSSPRFDILWYVPSPTQRDTWKQEQQESGKNVYYTSMSQASSSSHHRRRLVQVLGVSTNDDNNNSTTTTTATTILNKTAEIHNALQDATYWIFQSCLGEIPTASDVEYVVLDPDMQNGQVSFTTSSSPSMPGWYMTLWWQRTLSALYVQAVEKTQRQVELWMHMSYRRPLPRAVVEQFETQVLQKLIQLPDILKTKQPLEEKERGGGDAPTTTATTSSLWKALTVLQDCLALLNALERDDTYLPPLDFPPEQYAAIFAPLIVPLVIPLLVGLVREYRRYIEKTTRKAKSPPAVKE